MTDGLHYFLSRMVKAKKKKSNKLNFVTQLKPNKFEKQLVATNKAINTSEYVNTSISKWEGETASYRLFHQQEQAL